MLTYAGRGAAVVLGAVWLALAGFCAVFAAEDPARRCLADIAAAVDAADTVAFERAVAMDTLLDQMLGVILQEAQKPETAQEMPPLAAMLLSQGAGLSGDAVRGLLRNEAKTFVLSQVESGAFAGRAPAKGAAQNRPAPVFADASTGRKEIREVGEVRIVGNDRLLPFVLHDAGNGNNYPVTGRFSPGPDGRFRLTGVENTAELFHRILLESREAGE